MTIHRLLRLLPAVVLGVLLPGLAAAAIQIPDPPNVDATSWAILDYASGQLIAGNNADERVQPASITKVMTVYIAFDQIRQGRLKMSDTALVSEKAWHQGIDSSESRMFLDLGSRVSIENLLRGIIIQSGNDASVALAEHIAGSEDAFVQLMNQYAKQLGMTNTLYDDASGVADAPHYSSAHDLVTLARDLIHNFPEGYKIFSEREFTWHGIRQMNRNGLLEKDPSVDGIKTGHTSAAGYCLLASAVRNGRRLITAVMGAKTWAGRERGNLELLNYAFRFYDDAILFGPAAPAATLRVYKGDATQLPVGTAEPVALTVPTGAKDQLKIEQKVAARAIAPIAAGQVLGTATISLDGKVLKTVDLVALKAVGPGSFFHRLWDQILLWLGF